LRTQKGGNIGNILRLRGWGDRAMDSEGGGGN